MSKTYRPDSLAELLELMAGQELIPFAGGTDLMVRYKGVDGPEFDRDVVFVGHLEELQGIRVEGKELIIGGATLLSDIENSDLVPDCIRRAAAGIAAPALRNRGTMGGNICNASPAGDSIPPLYAFGGSLRLASKSGERVVSAEEFFTGPGRTVRRSDEILKEIIFPLKEWNVVKYRKVGTRAANALTKCSITALAKCKNGRIDDLAVAFGAVGPVIVRDQELEAQLKGLTWADLEGKIDSVLSDYSTVIIPIDDQRSTAVYRKQVCLNLLKEFLTGDLKKSLEK